ncbi:MAG TPA: hypothetical protein VMH20_04985 [Verrucomicrobiae bacterium]|nr:hypothetical protein [Verrucomicrobiae bacterium]
MQNSGPKIEDIRFGGWIIASYKSFKNFDLEDAVFDPYEATILAGKAAELLSSLRSLGQIDSAKFEVYRKLAHIKPRDTTPVIEQLERLNAVDVIWEHDDNGRRVEQIQSHRTTKAEVFDATAQYFRGSNASHKALASIEILDATLLMPVRESDILSKLHEKKFNDETSHGAVTDLMSFGLLTRTKEKETGEHLLYSPYVFSQNATDAFKVLKSLNSKARTEAMAILEHVQKSPGVPFPPNLDRDIIAVLSKSGIIDISGVQVRGGAANREFPTAPHVWGAIAGASGGPQLSADLIDDSKLLLNSLRYGEYYSPSSRGRINDPSVLVNALIVRGQVGPATAIGEDYPLPLARGIVSIAESRLYPGRYFMELRKQDVAEAVRDILQQNIILPAGDLDATEALAKPGAFRSPEEVRFRKSLPPEFEAIRDSLAFDLRTLRKPG